MEENKVIYGGIYNFGFSEEESNLCVVVDELDECIILYNLNFLDLDDDRTHLRWAVEEEVWERIVEKKISKRHFIKVPGFMFHNMAYGYLGQVLDEIVEILKEHSPIQDY